MPEQSSEFIPANFVYDLKDTKTDTIIDTTHLNERNDDYAAELFFGEYGHIKKNTYKVEFQRVEFEQEQLDRILKGRCPFCNGENPEGGFVEIDSGSAWQQVACPDCTNSWIEYYNYAGAEPNQV